MEPLEMPTQWGWSDETEPPPEDWWRSGDKVEWLAPELSLENSRTLVLHADEPFPADEWPFFRTD
jgi:hypothetical protein